MGPRGERRRPPGALRRLLELLGLTALAVAQPVLDVFGADPVTFLSRRVDGAELVAFAVAVALLPPAVLWVAEEVLALVAPRLLLPVHVTLVGGLIGLTVLGWVHTVTWPTAVVYGLTVTAGVVGAVAYIRWDEVSTWLRYLSPAPALFVANFVLLAPTSALVGSHSTSTASSGGDGPPVVMIMFDELPEISLLDGSGGIDRLAYPNIAALVDESTWYRNNTTVADSTDGAVPAILTGRSEVARGVVATSATLPDTLFSLFPIDADLVSVEWVTDVCPPVRCRGDREEVDEAAEVRGLVDEAWSVFTELHRPGAQGPSDHFAVTDRSGLEPYDIGEFDRFLDLATSGAHPPDLSYLHAGLPHQPWIRLPDGDWYDDARPLDGQLPDGFVSEEAARVAQRRHLVQVQTVDRLVGELRHALEADGWWDDALVVITADHGVAFGAGEPTRVVTPTNATQIAWTPAFVRWPGSTEAEVVDTPTRSIDLVPTIAGVLDEDVPWAHDGVDLRSVVRDDETVTVADVHNGGTVDVSVTDGFRTMLESGPDLRGTNADLRPYRTGPYGDLVGRPVDDLRASGGPSPARAVVASGADLPYDPTHVPVPVYAEGTVALPPGTPIAIAVDGRVAFVTEAEPGLGDPAPWWGLLPEVLLRPGDNQVEVYVVEGGVAAPRLRPLSKQ